MNNEKKQDDITLTIKRGRGRPKKETPTSDVIKKPRGRPHNPESTMRNFQISRRWIESPDNLSSIAGRHTKWHINHVKEFIKT